MKAIKYLVLIAVSALFFTSCTLELGKWEVADLSNIPDRIEFSGRGRTATDVFLNSGEEHRTSQYWITIHWDGRIQVARNNTGQPRTGTVSIIFGGETFKTITVAQAALDFVAIGDLYVQRADIRDDVITFSVANTLAQASRVEDFTDWRLPTLAELRVMYENREMIGGFRTTLQTGNHFPFYWATDGWGNRMVKNFYNGAEFTGPPDNQVGAEAGRHHVYARLVRVRRSGD